MAGCTMRSHSFPLYLPLAALEKVKISRCTLPPVIKRFSFCPPFGGEHSQSGQVLPDILTSRSFFTLGFLVGVDCVSPFPLPLPLAAGGATRFGNPGRR